MVIKAESVQEQGLPAGVDVMAAGDAEAAQAVGSRRRKKVQTELSGEHVASKVLCDGTVSPAEEADGKMGGARRAVKKTKGTCAGAVNTADEAADKLGGVGMAVVKKMAASRPESRTEFRGVSRKVNGKYTAEDAAAVELHGASAVTNFKPSGESSGQAEGSVKTKVKKPPAAKPDAWTEFRGVSRTAKGRYYAQIWDSRVNYSRKLGTFDTAVEAARAFDAAAVKLRGAAARTNFEQQPTAAATDDGVVSSIDLSNDFPELPAPDFSESLTPGPHMDDHRTDLPAADWQLVHEFLKDFDKW